MAYKHISLPQTFSAGDPTEWFGRYELCCTANAWDDDMKALKLPTLLEGEALAVWMDLSENQQKSYGDAKAAVLERMAPASFVSLDDFHARKLHPGEGLSVYLHNLRKLLNQAMPGVDRDTKEKLLLHQLLVGLPATISRQLRSTGDVEDLEAVMKRAKLLMTLEEKETKVAVVQPEVQAVDELRQQIAALTDQVAALTTKPRMIRCFNCHQMGHVQRNCPQLRSCYTCGRKGHLAWDCRQGNGRGASRMGQGRPQRQ